MLVNAIYPLTCLNSRDTCQRGRYFEQWAWAFYSQQCLYVAIVVVMSGLLYWTIRSQYLTTNRYASRESLQMKERTRDVANQALLFAAAAVYANMWSIIVTTEFTTGASPLWTKISVINGVPAFNSQGFFNFLVYIRPRYIRIRRKRPELGRWGALVHVVCGNSNQRRPHVGSFLSDSVGSGTDSATPRWLSMFRRKSLPSAPNNTNKNVGSTITDTASMIASCAIVESVPGGGAVAVKAFDCIENNVFGQSHEDNDMAGFGHVDITMTRLSDNSQDEVFDASQLNVANTIEPSNDQEEEDIESTTSTAESA